MKAPVSHLKNSTLKDAPQALMRAAEESNGDGARLIY